MSSENEASESFPPLAVTGGVEQSILAAATRLLSECLQSASGAPANVQLTCWEPVRSDFLNPSEAPAIADELRERGIVPPGFRRYGDSLSFAEPRVVVLSLLADVVQPALRHRRDGYRFVPLAEWQRNWTAAQREWVAAEFVEEPVLDYASAARHWRAILAAVQQTAGANVFLCNVFRYTPGRPVYRYYGMPESLGERIRRFNFLAAELSQETGIYIVDLDRVFAHHGAQEMHTDYRLGGEDAATRAAQSLAWTVFQAGLDDFLSPDIQTKALANLEAVIAFSFLKRQAMADDRA